MEALTRMAGSRFRTGMAGHASGKHSRLRR